MLYKIWQIYLHVTIYFLVAHVIVIDRMTTPDSLFDAALVMATVNSSHHTLADCILDLSFAGVGVLGGEGYAADFVCPYFLI